MYHVPPLAMISALWGTRACVWHGFVVMHACILSARRQTRWTNACDSLNGKWAYMYIQHSSLKCECVGFRSWLSNAISVLTLVACAIIWTRNNLIITNPRYNLIRLVGSLVGPPAVMFLTWNASLKASLWPLVRCLCYREAEKHWLLGSAGPEIQYNMGPKQKIQYGAKAKDTCGGTENTSGPHDVGRPPAATMWWLIMWPASMFSIRLHMYLHCLSHLIFYVFASYCIFCCVCWSASLQIRSCQKLIKPTLGVQCQGVVFDRNSNLICDSVWDRAG